MQGISYPMPNDPHGYTYGGIQYQDQPQGGPPAGYIGRQGLRTPRRVTRDNTALRLTSPQFGIPSVVEQDRTSQKPAGFGFSSYTGPIQNAGYAGIGAETPVTDPSFGGGGAVLPTAYGGGAASPVAPPAYSPLSPRAITRYL